MVIAKIRYNYRLGGLAEDIAFLSEPLGVPLAKRVVNTYWFTCTILAGEKPLKLVAEAVP